MVCASPRWPTSPPGSAFPVSWFRSPCADCPGRAAQPGSGCRRSPRNWATGRTWRRAPCANQVAARGGGGGWRGGLPAGRGRAVGRIGCRRPRAAGHGRDPGAGRAALVVMDKRHGFSVLCEMSRGERVLGDPACVAPHPADDRGAGEGGGGVGGSGGGMGRGARGRGREMRRAVTEGGCRGHGARGEARPASGERESRGKFRAGTSRNGGGRRLRGVPPGGALHALHR